MKYIPVIGLEVHVELNTKSKMFCGCNADYFGKKPNTHTCPVCLGMPGALPVPNKKAIESCIKIGLHLDCVIPPSSKFDRKNYFYPDLPKGYQISQYDQPFCINGSVTLSNDKEINILRVHMEEDTAKLTHSEIDGENVSLVDFNRSGVPLVEIVTGPDFETGEEVSEYLKKLQLIVRHLGVSNADIEKGDMRMEPNISLRVEGRNELPSYKVEVKNINSFRFVAKAINFEIKRQSEILNRGEIPAQETRGWNEGKNETVSQRSKEEAHDYRYFPEPDIPPIRWSEQELDKFRSNKPQMADEKIWEITAGHSITKEEASFLAKRPELIEYLREAVNLAREKGISPSTIVKTIKNKKIEINKTSPEELISDIQAKSSNIISDEGELEKLAKQAIEENPIAAEDYKAGKESVLQVLVGGVMRLSSGKADPGKAKEILEKLLS